MRFRINALGALALILCTPMAVAQGVRTPIATVNGALITQTDVDVEIAATKAPAGVSPAVVRQQALQHVIDRKLMVGALGSKTGATLSAADARAAELILVQTYAKQVADAVPEPTDAQLDSFMADHANAFAGRQSLLFDQLRCQPNADQLKQLPIIQPDHTVDAVAAHLTQLGIKYDRTQVKVDTAALPTELVKLIDGLPPGEPFVLPANGIMTINAIIGRTPTPTPPDQARAGASGAWHQQQLVTTITDRMKTLRAAARITYQPGFEPPAAAH